MSKLTTNDTWKPGDRIKRYSDGAPGVITEIGPNGNVWVQWDSSGPRAGTVRWTVDEAATKAELMASRVSQLPGGGGVIVYVDEHGNRRRLPADMSTLSDEERDAALDAMTEALEAPSLAQAFGAPSPNLAMKLAIERLTELRAAGRMSEEQYLRERKRLEDY